MLKGGANGGETMHSRLVISLQWVYHCSMQTCSGNALVRDPYARCCGRGGAVRRPPIPIIRPEASAEECGVPLRRGKGLLSGTRITWCRFPLVLEDME